MGSVPTAKTILLEHHDAAFRIVTTDNYRIAISDLDDEDAHAALLDGKVVPSEFFRAIPGVIGVDREAHFGTDEGGLVIRSTRGALETRFSADKFPKYRPVVERLTSTAEFTGSKHQIIEALRRALIVIGPKYAAIPVKFDFTSVSPVLTMSVERKDLGSESEALEGEWEGTSFTVRYNATWLIEALQSFVGETIRLTFQDDRKPMKITSPDDEGYAYYIMPVAP
jgi:DNA polymerase-3 subunit beta